MHKTVFTWFDNLLTFTELQGFHYYQGKKNTKCDSTVFISCTQDSQWVTKWAKFFFLGALPPDP